MIIIFSIIWQTIKYHIQSVLFCCQEKIPASYQDEFFQEKLAKNLKITAVVTDILLILNLAMVFIDLTRFTRDWVEIPAYINLFYAHLLIIAVIICYKIFVRLKFIYRLKEKRRLLNDVNITLAIFLLVWCGYLSINAQYIHGQISAYLLGIFTLASSFILTPLESFVIYFSSYMFFLSGLLYVQQGVQLSGNIINSIFLLILAFVISRFKYSSYLNNFINQKLINQKNKELNRLYEEKKQKLDETLEYEKLRTAFFANLSHELKTPLNLIYSAQQMLDISIQKETKSLKGKNRKYLKIIKQNCYRLIRLVGNLIDMTKIDAGFYKITLINSDIVKLVKKITLSVSEYTRLKEINLSFRSDYKKKVIACDPDKIERIVLNLLSNAIKFTPPGGEITVYIRGEEDRILITVRDTGIGIPEEMKGKIFERFVQVDKSTSRNNEGSGIGLSLVKMLVELHQGQITVTNDYLAGSEFVVELPDRTLDQGIEGDQSEDFFTEQNIEKIDIEFSDIYL